MTTLNAVADAAVAATQAAVGPDRAELMRGLEAAAREGFDHDFPIANGRAACPSCRTTFHPGDVPVAGAQQIHDAMGHDDLCVVRLVCPSCGTEGRLVASTLDLHPSGELEVG